MPDRYGTELLALAEAVDGRRGAATDDEVLALRARAAEVEPAARSGVLRAIDVCRRVASQAG